MAEITKVQQTAVNPLLPRLLPLQRRVLQALLLGFGHWITVEHEQRLERLPEPAIFVFNHNCSYETLLVACFLLSRRDGRPISFVIDWMFSRIPLVGWLFRQMDPVLVYNKPSTIPWWNRERDRQPRQSIIAQCLNRLQNGQSIGVYPEGTRNRDPLQLQRARKGIGQIVLASGAPVIPIGIDFPQRINKGIPHWGPLILRIGEPLRFTAPASDSQSSGPATDQRRQTIHRSAVITHQIMVSLAELSGKSYPFPEPPGAEE